MGVIWLYFLISAVALTAIPFLKAQGKGIAAYLAVVANAGLTSWYAISALLSQNYELLLSGSVVTGAIPIRLDALSAWFILIANLVFLTGGFYGIYYMKAYRDRKSNLSLHCFAFVLLHAAFLPLFVIQNGFVFLVFMEVMALSAFTLVIFDAAKSQIIKAGLNYLIQSHIAIVLLTSCFLWVFIKTGSFDMATISSYTTANPGASSIFLFLGFFMGFALKTGFVPFHTWLPYAHPVAPAHVSGIMSGVLIKLGIYGILRMIILVKTDYTTIGYIMVIISMVSGLYGIMLAIVQENLKKMLAYSSIENISIIGLGIGIGCIGLGNNNVALTTMGFAGALLHSFNHSLFKSMLFYSSGIVYQATHTLKLEHLGGLIKKMPQTALLFLTGSIAISGIPPFNGFISEFMIYSGLYHWIQDSTLAPLVLGIFAILALVMIGGLALLCFTKAFGIVFLGSPRHEFHNEVKEPPFLQLLPLYILAFLMLVIGLFPKQIFVLLGRPIALLTGQTSFVNATAQPQVLETLHMVGWSLMSLILMILVLYFVRKMLTRNQISKFNATWGCGYRTSSPKLQYTGSSYSRTFSRFFSAVIMLFKKEKSAKTIFPQEGFYETNTYDRLEKWLIDNPLMAIKSLMNRFLFLQNGRLQYYILYGTIFIIAFLAIPVLYDKILQLIEFLK